jgi:hypothetical protein
MFKCRTCQKEFSSEGSLERHLKAHGGSGEYYQTWYPRRDLWDKSFIKFKDKKQYLSSFFNSYSNRTSYYQNNFGKDAKDVLLTEFLTLKDVKNISFLPCDVYLRLAQMAGVDIIRKYFESCQEFCKELDLIQFYNKKLPKDFWERKNSEYEMEVHVDSREKKPFKFFNSIVNKLDFGDYTAGGEKYSKTFVDRKSVGDFFTTFASQSNFERFKREIKRAKEFDSFLFVVVESSLDSLPEYAGTNKFMKNGDRLLSFALHNVRDILINDYESCQFVFCRNTPEANEITRKILYYGREMWNCDLGYFISKR